jgi:preprotein translocase subunit SecA
LQRVLGKAHPLTLTAVKNLAEIRRSQDGDRGELAATRFSQPMRRAGTKVGRNKLCPCGSGKKYKKCHGAAVAPADFSS